MTSNEAITTLLKMIGNYILKAFGLKKAFDSKSKIILFFWKILYICANLWSFFWQLMLYIAFRTDVSAYIHSSINLQLCIFVILFWIGNFKNNYPIIIKIRIVSDIIIFALQVMLMFTYSNAGSIIFLFISWLIIIWYHKKTLQHYNDNIPNLKNT